MDTKPIIADIDPQIAKLEQAKVVLLSLDTLLVKRKPGRPKGATVKRRLSLEARAKIAAAQKKRWAAVKKAKGGGL